MKIAVAGTGYVGLSNAVLLAQHNTVVALDIDEEKVAKLRRKESPIEDGMIESYLADKPLDLVATTDKAAAFEGADFVVVATPTDYDPETNYFNTRSVEAVISDVLAIQPGATIIVKSTVPVGYTASLRDQLGAENILFSPEFLREGKALYDNLYPSRIVVGGHSDEAHTFAGLLALTPLKLRPSSCLPIPIWPCGWRTSMSWTAMRRPMGWILVRSLMGCAWIRVLVATITILHSATVVTVCPRIPSSCWPTIGMCPTT